MLANFCELNSKKCFKLSLRSRSTDSVDGQDGPKDSRVDAQSTVDSLLGALHEPAGLLGFGPGCRGEGGREGR